MLKIIANRVNSIMMLVIMGNANRVRGSEVDLLILLACEAVVWNRVGSHAFRNELNRLLWDNNTPLNHLPLNHKALNHLHLNHLLLWIRGDPKRKGPQISAQNSEQTYYKT